MVEFFEKLNTDQWLQIVTIIVLSLTLLVLLFNAIYTYIISKIERERFKNEKDQKKRNLDLNLKVIGRKKVNVHQSEFNLRNIGSTVYDIQIIEGEFNTDLNVEDVWFKGDQAKLNVIIPMKLIERSELESIPNGLTLKFNYKNKEGESRSSVFNFVGGTVYNVL